MQKLLSIFIIIVSFNLIFNSVIAQDFILKKENAVTVGRGIVKWEENSVSISDCFISLKDKIPKRFEMSFSAKTHYGEDQIQIWSGFGFQDRDNRIILKVPTNTSATIYAKTSAGSVTYSNLTISDLVESDGLLTGNLGSAHGEIHLETENGDIEIIGFD